jgi:hypothetical protein
MEGANGKTKRCCAEQIGATLNEHEKLQARRLTI